jgi:uncharacterized OB-fold protein
VTWTVLPSKCSGDAPEGQVTGIAELAEGPWLLCSVDVPASERRAGMQVRVGLSDPDLDTGLRVPVCRPK